MASIGRTVGIKAAKSTARHSVRGVASKARRQPLRSVTLLSIGWMMGASAGWKAGRKTCS